MKTRVTQATEPRSGAANAQPHTSLQRELARRQPPTAQSLHAPGSIAQPPHAAGVYVIRNRVNGRVYVAGDQDVHGALHRERHELAHRRHRNAALQSDWNCFGAENFTLEVVAKAGFSGRIDSGGCASLPSLVDAWRDELHSYGDTGYNARVRLAL